MVYRLWYLSCEQAFHIWHFADDDSCVCHADRRWLRSSILIFKKKSFDSLSTRGPTLWRSLWHKSKEYIILLNLYTNWSHCAAGVPALNQWQMTIQSVSSEIWVTSFLSLCRLLLHCYFVDTIFHGVPFIFSTHSTKSSMISSLTSLLIGTNRSRERSRCQDTDTALFVCAQLVKISQCFCS